MPLRSIYYLSIRGLANTNLLIYLTSAHGTAFYHLKAVPVLRERWSAEKTNLVGN
ncbi:hypothetical protein BDP81DRAFT_439449 [Colletotrichum phormii]|uniref:Uncharacterized protein n=1 Tax=Colletotrichum phormii TaxID=359342 RepID=A0AAI9ZF41_9PEZI|nr:uncharacterized protein BDP81DRAFT_439449 [Colletotrichum phormii]KAK1623389.1 hypothetical protein BDP81DRAFT_439449 [Colletotrichum phormii]